MVPIKGGDGYLFPIGGINTVAPKADPERERRQSSFLFKGGTPVGQVGTD